MTESKPHILLVEDYAANVLVATALLEEFGYEYTVIKNGQEAVKVVKEQPFDLVLMDIQMPGIDGFEATHFIREWERGQTGRHTPIIGMTAFALTGDRERCLAAGMDDYISKPFHPDDLKNKLQRHLSPA